MGYFITLIIGVVLGIAISYFVFKNNKVRANKIVK